MISNVLRASLIKSAVLVGVISLLVYLTATSPEGSFWASLGTLFMAMFRGVQLAVGLVISLAFCLAVLTGIFLGSVAIISRKSSARMTEMLRQEISDKLLFVRGLVIKEVPAGGERIVEQNGREIRKDIAHVVQEGLAGIQNEQSVTQDTITTLSHRVDEIEKRFDLDSIILQVEQHGPAIEKLSGQLGAVLEKVEQLQARNDELAEQVQKGASESDSLELTEKINELQQQSLALQAELTEIKDVLSAGPNETIKKSTPEAEEVEHRLFAHLRNRAAREKVEKLVTETLETNMSYAQVIDLLVKETKGKTADIIAAHPSLTEDYIRYRRNNG